MNPELEHLLVNYPKLVKREDIVDFYDFDLRVSAVDSLVINTIGILKDSIEFCPDNDPPLREEILCWIWAIRPDLSNAILEFPNLSEGLITLLNAHIEGNIDRFFVSRL